MTKTITQSEARRLRKRVKELEQKLQQIENSYSREYPGTYVATFTAGDVLLARIDTAKRLGHNIIARKGSGVNEINLYASEKAP